jgi:hypothetical protein
LKEQIQYNEYAVIILTEFHTRLSECNGKEAGSKEYLQECLHGGFGLRLEQ